MSFLVSIFFLAISYSFHSKLDHSGHVSLCNMIGMDFNVSLYQVPVGVQTNDKYVINGKNANETRLKIMQLSEEDQGSYWCHAIFQLGESEEHIELVVLSYLVPLKAFLAIAAEVVLLVAIILLCEMYTQKRKKPSGRISFFR